MPASSLQPCGFAAARNPSCLINLRHFSPLNHGRKHEEHSIQHAVSRPDQRRSCKVFDFHDQLIQYETAWKLQKDLVAQLCEQTLDLAKPETSDFLLLLQHPPVYTLGAGSSESHLLFDPSSPPHPLHRTERGGEVTYHGPGQLVLYPILDLRSHVTDLHWYMRALEEVVIRALESVSGVHGERVEGLTGVWVDGRKVAAVGVRARRWVTYHGIALNITTDLQPFSAIVPCGISGRCVTSVQEILFPAKRLEDRRANFSYDEQDRGGQVRILEGVGPEDGLREAQLLREYRYALLESFSEVFELALEMQPQIEGIEMMALA